MDVCWKSEGPIRWVGFVAICVLLLSDNAVSQDSGAVSGKPARADEFEVATVKPHPGVDYTIELGTPESGRYRSTNITAKVLIEQAFELPSDQVTGGPSWIGSQRFDLIAKIADDRWQQISKLRREEQNHIVNGMVQSLLKDRFGLVVSHHPKELTVYALVVGKGGPKLRAAGSPRPQGEIHGSFLMGATLKDAPVTELAKFLSGHFNRTVLDQTGLTGRYDIEFDVRLPDDRSPEGADDAVFEALQDQLGLKVVSRKAVVDTIVIDHLEEPSEN